MRTRRKPPTPTVGDSVLREIIESPEYKQALKDRLLAGKATSQELSLARELNVAVSVQDKDEQAREALRALDPDSRQALGDILRLTDRVETARRIRITYTMVDDAPVSADQDLTESDLLPRR